MKPVAVDPKTTTRAAAYELWMNAPNPMVTFFKTTLGISFQFHHTQMDGAHAGRFLEMLQTEINNIKHLRIAADLQGTERDFL